MISKLHLQWLINHQRIIARKAIASYETNLYKDFLSERAASIKKMARERKFLAHSFADNMELSKVIEIIHIFRHNNISKNNKLKDCLECKNVLANMAIEVPDFSIENEIIPENNEEEDLKPRFGNLLAILEQEAMNERAMVESKRTPSPNDMTRWALKDAVLAFYQGINMPENMVIVDTAYDDRLTTQLAPDFDVIAKIWMTKLDELMRRNNKYMLSTEEYDKAEADLADGMRGSAFEKQLDRYREEFMKKLKR